MFISLRCHQFSFLFSKELTVNFLDCYMRIEKLTSIKSSIYYIIEANVL